MSGNDAEAGEADGAEADSESDAAAGGASDADAGGPADASGPTAGDQASGDSVTGDPATGADRPGVEQSGEPPEGEHDSLLAAVRVTRHARVGLAVGLGLAALLYVPRYPVFDASIEGARGYYLGLAFVLAATTAAVVTAALSVKTFLEPVLDRAAWLRRGGVVAMLGGLGWIAAPACAALADAGTIDVRLWRNVTSLGSLALLVGTIGFHAAVRPAAARLGDRTRRIERAAYWLALVGLLIAAANATGNAAPMETVDGSQTVTPFLIGALLATIAGIPLALVAERSGALPRWRTRALLVGGVASSLAISWIGLLGGWDWLVGTDLPDVAVGLAIALVPAGVGWVLAGQGLWASVQRAGDSDGGTHTYRENG
ncbi:DUF7536 family protein [Salinarchaeum laminariae]|uniref:DUF7536 family protein n=1 Tax=Salinarchaeum laminariae TaxID=869888 RepID=UPI0020BFF7BF|nr:hypothetical protein [Salinarchaeum laminariae]